MSLFMSSNDLPADVLRRLIKYGGDVGCLRPFVGDDGQSYITLNVRGKSQTIVTNAPATLRKDEWTLLDQQIIKVAKQRLRAWGHLMERGLRYNIPNGLAKTVLQYQNVSDISAAEISMDGLRESQRDRPVFDLVNLPLPIIHKDFSYSARELLASHTTANFMGGGPSSSLDTTTAELAARRVAEEVEKLLLGTAGSYSFGGGTIYGYTNFPSRATKVMTAPTGSNPAATLADVLAMRTQSQNMNHFGPWVLYVSTSWDGYLDNDYILTGGNVATQSLRNRLKMIEGIEDVVTLNYLPAKTMVLVQMTPEVVRGIVGMEIMTVDWSSFGGMQQNFKTMCINVPQLRTDQVGNTGIVHGTHA